MGVNIFFTSRMKIKYLLICMYFFLTPVNADFVFQDNTNHNSLWVCQEAVCHQLSDSNKTELNITTVYEIRGSKVKQDYFDTIMNNPMLLTFIIISIFVIGISYHFLMKK